LVIDDTDVVSYIFQQHPSGLPFVSAFEGHPLYVSFMTVAEIEHGMATAKWGDQKRNRMRSHLAAFQVYESCPELCRLWGDVMAESAATGRRMSREDAWIAATALHLSAPSATHNRKHFAHLTRLVFFPL